MASSSVASEANGSGTQSIFAGDSISISPPTLSSSSSTPSLLSPSSRALRRAPSIIASPFTAAAAAATSTAAPLGSSGSQPIFGTALADSSDEMTLPERTSPALISVDVAACSSPGPAAALSSPAAALTRSPSAALIRSPSSDAYSASKAQEQHVYMHFRVDEALVADERAAVERRLGQLKNMGVLSGLFLSCVPCECGSYASTYLGQVRIPSDGSVSEVIIALVGAIALIIVVLQATVLFLTAVMAFAVLNRDCRAILDAHHPQPHFATFWNVNCEMKYVIAFRCFYSSVLFFLVATALCGCIQFKQSVATQVLIGVVMVVVFLYCALYIVHRWAPIPAPHAAPPLPSSPSSSSSSSSSFSSPSSSSACGDYGDDGICRNAGGGLAVRPPQCRLGGACAWKKRQ